MELLCESVEYAEKDPTHWMDPDWHNTDRRPKQWVLARAESRVPVAGLQIHSARLLLGPLEILCTVIANVYTPKEYRNKGFASWLLHNVALDRGMDGIRDVVLVLFSQPRTLYERVGFKQINTHIHGQVLYAMSLTPRLNLGPSKDWIVA